MNSNTDTNQSESKFDNTTYSNTLTKSKIFEKDTTNEINNAKNGNKYDDKISNDLPNSLHECSIRSDNNGGSDGDNVDVKTTEDKQTSFAKDSENAESKIVVRQKKCKRNETGRLVFNISKAGDTIDGLYPPISPECYKCRTEIEGDCLNAIGKHFHPKCFRCMYCGKSFAHNSFFYEAGYLYCESDWNNLFTTKCFGCNGFIRAGDKWVEALHKNYHSQCFNCMVCNKNLKKPRFFVKKDQLLCKTHAC